MGKSWNAVMCTELVILPVAHESLYSMYQLYSYS